MTITMQGLLHADTAGLRAVAERWAGLTTQLDTTAGDLIDAVRDLPNHWAGAGGQAAQQRGTTLQARLGNTPQPCDAIGRALVRLADELDDHRLRLRALISDAAAEGLHVDVAAGTVTLPYEAGSAWSGGLAAEALDAFVTQVAAVLDAANEADRRAAAALDDNQVGEHDLPGAEVPEIYPDVVLATAVYSPESRAHWWHAQHPLNREKIIAAYPELIGAGEGLPSTVRDEANRLLLHRARNDLESRRRRLDEMQDGAGSRAVLDVDHRLAEIADTERRLAADPAARLLGFQPPVIGTGDPKWDNYRD